MTLIKADIVESVNQNVRLKSRRKTRQQFLFPEMDCVFLGKRRAAEILDSLLETIKETLIKGRSLRISGFGRFQVKFKWARKGRNPRTGEMIMLRSRQIVTFHTSPKLKKKINSMPDNIQEQDIE